MSDDSLRSVTDVANSARALCRMVQTAQANPVFSYQAALQISEMVHQALLNLRRDLWQLDDMGADTPSMTLMHSLCEDLEAAGDLLGRQVIALSSISSRTQ